MIPFTFLLIVLGLAVYLAKVADFLYRFQIKEYRFDRFRSGMREWGWLRTIFGSDIRIPAFSVRNVGIGSVLALCGVFFTCTMYYMPLPVTLSLIAAAPVAAFIDVAALVLLTSVPAAWHRERIIKQAERKLAARAAPVIAVTGSYGKTSVKEHLYEILKTTYKVAKTDQNRNTDVGVALSILKNLKDDTEYFIAEMGAYRKGEIAKICRSFRPGAVVVTAFGNQHLDLYGSKKNLVEAESEPLAFLQSGETAYINRDIPEYHDIKDLGPYRVVSYSLHSKHAHIYADHIKTDSRGTSAVIHRKGKLHKSHDTTDCKNTTTAIQSGSKPHNHSSEHIQRGTANTHSQERAFTIHTKLLGKHVVQNLLPAIAIGLDLGVPPEKIQRAIAKLEPIPHKGSLHTNRYKTTVYSNSSNANVEGCIETIRVMATFLQSQKVLITKGIIELGSDKLPSYRRIIAELEAHGVKLFTTDPDFHRAMERGAAPGIGAAGSPGKESCVHVLPNEAALLAALNPMQGPDTLIGIVGRFTKPFIDSMI